MIPIRSSDLDYSKHWPKYIIIHDTKELDLKSSSVITDKSDYQLNKLSSAYYQSTGETNLPYHLVIEKVKDDYQVSVARPMFTKCIFEDLPSEMDDAIHIAILGDVDKIVNMKRLYDVMAFKAIVPYMRLFNIPFNRVFTHSEISTKSNIDCPGKSFNIEVLQTIVRSKMKKVTMTRNN